MFAGRRFRITSATLVTHERLSYRLPVGTVIEVVAEPNGADRMVSILWDGLLCSMFTIDFRQRSEDVDSPSSSVLQDPTEVRASLLTELHAAQERRDLAAKLCQDVIEDIPSELPQPDGTARIENASRDLAHANHRVREAFLALNEFVVLGTVREKPGQENSEDSEEKAGS
jgi:hypothetical protein